MNPTEHTPLAEAPFEGKTQEGHASLNQWLAVFTAILACCGAIINYQGSLVFRKALEAKNDAILKKAHATDLWNYYQAVSTKQHIMELAMLIAPQSASEGFKQKLQKYQSQKKELEEKARQLDEASEKANELSEKLTHPHRRLEQALTLVEIAIAVTSVAALTQKRWLLWLAGASAAGSLVLWGMAFWV
ncbi:DUF4337 domain-containing protein [Candidatus Methylacidithermus pantelleriae]|uniref:DUF4337 domain-containing protein n=1 Tax=Candidatus Methylacidithermus pantelleriae TaxID=2744239 RepID=A0A8J2BT07_9BACT|nr:DUF4337 domain-containing protein [Candidatus Methylacidithermus pantelleriae]CAF0696319.1 conserved hypothetical protein [Candidatus Methylacidithermus pantelleriae]